MPVAGLRRLGLGACAAIAALAIIASPHPGDAAETADIDLEIFNLEELEADKEAKISGGCSMTLWQHNKVPFKDKYYFVFYRDVLSEKGDAPGFVQISGKFLPISPFAFGGSNHGYELFDQQVFRGKDAGLWVIMDLKVGRTEGEVIRIDSGSMRVIQDGKPQFLVKVKGEAGC